MRSFCIVFCLLVACGGSQALAISPVLPAVSQGNDLQSDVKPPAKAQKVLVATLFNPRFSRGRTAVVGSVGRFSESQLMMMTGLDFQLVPLPTRRMLKALESTVDPMCTIGLFKTEARSRKYIFSAEIFPQEPRLVVTSATTFQQLGEPKSFIEFLGLGLELARSDGLSYGDRLEEMLVTHKVATKAFLGTREEIYLLLVRDRAGFMIVTQSSFEREQQLIPLAGKVRTYLFDDMPAAPSRHIACSPATNAQTMAAINQGIAAFKDFQASAR